MNISNFIYLFYWIRI